MKKAKNKNLRRTLGFLALAALTAGLAAMPLLTRQAAESEAYPVSILSAQAERRELTRVLSGGGTLQAEEAVSVTVPQGVRLTELLVKNGDTVEAGDPIARVDRVTVMQTIADIQEEMTSLQKQLESERTASDSETLTAPAGLVKAVYAQAGDSVETVMLRCGCLAEISLDSKMAVKVEADTTLRAGDKVTVTLNGEELEAAVESNLEGVLTVTFPDEGYTAGDTAALTGPGGEALGTGTLEIHSPWRAVATSGTVSQVYVKEGQTLRSKGNLLRLTDMGYSAQYRMLSSLHQEYAEQLAALFRLYQNLTLTAPAAGLITGLDPDSPLLLAASQGAQVTLLANAPDGSDAQYVNFVGQVTEVGTDGYIMRLNPQFLSVTDYTDLSGVPRDTAAMTYEAIYTGGAPVYQWDGSNWNSASISAGDLLLFAGDSGGSIVWVIRMGSAQLPDPEEPVDPVDPPDPVDPVDPADPSAPSAPSDPSEPTEPTEPSHSGSGGVSLPSFGGYGGSSGSAGSSTQQQTQTGPATVEVASLVPQASLTIPVTIDERDIHSLTLGQTVQVRVEALSGREFTGTVTEIGRIGASSGGSSKFTVTVELRREEDMLPGMSASVTAALGTETGVAIPLAALTQTGSRCVVYTSLDEKTGDPASPVEVTPGFSDGEYVLIQEGLSEGDTVYYPYYEALEG